VLLIFWSVRWLSPPGLVGDSFFSVNFHSAAATSPLTFFSPPTSPPPPHGLFTPPPSAGRVRPPRHSRWAPSRENVCSFSSVFHRLYSSLQFPQLFFDREFLSQVESVRPAPTPPTTFLPANTTLFADAPCLERAFSPPQTRLDWIVPRFPQRYISSFHRVSRYASPPTCISP